MGQEIENSGMQERSQEEIFFDNIRSNHPDFAEDREKYFSYANNRYNELKGDSKKYRDDVDMIYSSINENPVLSELFERSAKFPHNPSLALRSFKREDLADALEHYDDEVNEEVEKIALKDWRDKAEKERARQKSIADNQKEIPALIESFAKDTGVSVEDVDKLVSEIISPLADGRLSKDFLEMVYYYKNRDKEKKQEYERGLAEGRNSKIKEKDLQKRQSDGLPDVKGGNITLEEEHRPKNLIDSLVRKNAWEILTDK